MRSTDNRTSGNRFETAFATKLAGDGFWVTKLTQNASGQPADLIAVKNDKALLIDCKVCERDYFPFKRIEPNQQTAMMFWRGKGNHQYWFALQYENETYMLDGYLARYLVNRHGGVNVSDGSVCWPYETWKEMINHWLCA